MSPESKNLTPDNPEYVGEKEILITNKDRELRDFGYSVYDRLLVTRPELEKFRKAFVITFNAAVLAEAANDKTFSLSSKVAA